MRRILFFMLAVFILAGCSQDGSKESKYRLELKQGSYAVDFLYKDMQDVPFRLSKQNGKVVILYFWRMKCEECKLELKSLEELYRAYKDKGLVVVSVDADTMHSSPVADVREFMDKEGIAFTRIRDSDGFVSEAYGVLRAPESYVIDKNGVVASIHKNRTDWTSAEKRAAIESLLNAR